jgi:MFS transporter, ACS family, hexuronate transporter
VTDWLPLHWRARAASFGLSGAPIASIIGSPLITYLMFALNWRMMFLIIGCVGVLWALCWLFHFRHYPKLFFAPVSKVRPSKGFSKQKIHWKQILYNGNFQLTCLIFFTFVYTVFFALMWLPGYLIQMHHTSTLSTGYLVLPAWICSAVFTLLGGWLSDFLLKRTGSLRKSRSLLIGFSFLFSGLSFLSIIFADQLFMQLFWMSLGLGFSFAPNAPIYALLADLFGPSVGIAQGFISFFFGLASAVSPFLTGWVTQVTGNFQAAFFIIAVLSISASLLLLFFQHPDRKINTEIVS